MSKDKTLNYRIVGNGYPVLFLHGFLESNSMWENLIPQLKQHYKCIFIELPGHGRSALLNTEPPSIEIIAERVKNTIESVTKEQYSIVGHSLGGYVALSLIESLPNFDQKLILLNSHPWQDSPSKKMERNRVADVVKKNKALFIKTAIPNLYRKPDQHKLNVDSLIKEAMTMKKSAIIDSLKAMRDRSDRLKVMESLKSNCLVIQGRFDHLIDATLMKKLTEKNKNEFQIIENAGHMAHHESKQKVISCIFSFI